ncbi:MAG: hypothetical protein RR630_09430 [Coprobacillus sp.]
MDKSTTDYQKLLKGLGLFCLVIAAFLTVILVMSLIKIQSGEVQLTEPLWIYLLEPVIYIILQASMGICAILFVKTDKVKICMIVSALAIICMFVFLFIINREDEFMTKVSKLIFPALYFGISFNLFQANKKSS